ncbi:MAG: molybdopterin-dependent oxidoreductase [Syntrophobacteraceae bacterium]
MAKVTLKINGLEVEVEEGATILEAAKQAGVFIPTLCYHPYLPLEEACRICVVEEVRGGWSSLVAACVYPVRNGMTVETDSELVIRARQTIIDLLLSNHPTDCMTCYAAGKCELQDFAFLYGIKQANYRGEQSNLPVDSDPNPYLHIDMNKCILCRRCVRACHDIQGADIWSKVGRGFHQRVATAFDTTLEEAGCEMCGHCADFCPVDAIGFRSGRGEIRSWQLQDESTVCLQCSCGCRAQYEKIGDKIVRVIGDFSSPVSVGALCKKGRFNFDFINSPDRITEAAVRINGVLDPMPVENALEFASLGLNHIRKYSGPDAIGVICGDMLTNEEYYLAQKFARAGIGTNNIDSVAGPWQQAAYLGLKAGFGDGLIGNPMSGIANARSILVLGSNTIEKHAIAALRARKAARDNAVMIVAHPETVPLKKTATLHLPVEPGAEDALVKGLLKAIVEDGLAAEVLEGEAGKNLKKFMRGVKSTPWKEISEKTGLSDNVIREAAKLYASNQPAVLLYGIDPASSPVNEEFYHECCLLQQLVNTTTPARNTIFLMGSAGNAQGAAEFGALPGYLPGFHPVGSGARKTASKLWGAEVPAKPGMSWPEMFSAIERESLKGLYLVGVDPYELGMPEEQVRRRLEKLEFLVVEDCVKTRACEQAHLVLPATSFVEKDGTAINAERRLQLLERIIASPGQAQSDFDLLNGLIVHYGPQLGAKDPSAVLKEAAQFIPDLEGIASESITAAGIILGKENAESVIQPASPEASEMPKAASGSE